MSSDSSQRQTFNEITLSAEQLASLHNVMRQYNELMRHMAPGIARVTSLMPQINDLISQNSLNLTRALEAQSAIIGRLTLPVINDIVSTTVARWAADGRWQPPLAEAGMDDEFLLDVVDTKVEAIEIPSDLQQELASRIEAEFGPVDETDRIAIELSVLLVLVFGQWQAAMGILIAMLLQRSRDQARVQRLTALENSSDTGKA